ncbi:MAG: hypothetical protein M3Y56_12365 [Armatimonadota bacterium]|nr:hypothetical protein [Armatimonadota bacterium]
MIRSSGFLMLLVLHIFWLPSMPARAARHTLYTYELTFVSRVDVHGAAARRQARDERQVAASLQGIVNRKESQLYVFLVGDNARIDCYWLRRLQEPGEWLEKTPIKPLKDLLSALKHFSRSLRGDSGLG